MSLIANLGCYGVSPVTSATEFTWPVCCWVNLAWVPLTLITLCFDVPIVYSSARWPIVLNL
ncbi:MAG: hypothetical protein ACYCS7_16070 [Acidimicrobiales bacterium]